jgi:hypothetical protein
MKKSGFDLEHVACYVKYMRRGEGVQEARRQAYAANAIDRRARTAARMRHTLTDREMHEFLSDVWLVFLDSWRRCAREVEVQLCGLGASQKDAAEASGAVYNATCAIMGQAREYGREKFEKLLQRVADEQRIAELMKEFEEATEA